MGCLTDGYIGVEGDTNWLYANVGGSLGTEWIQPADLYEIAWCRQSDGAIAGAKVNIDGSVQEGPVIDLSETASIPTQAPRDDEAERPYIVWAGVNPMSLTEGLIVWNKEVMLLNRNAIIGNAEEGSEVEFVSIVGRLMVVKLKSPVPIDASASSIITIGAGAVGMYTSPPDSTCPTGEEDEEAPEDEIAVGIPPGGDLTPPSPSCGNCADGGQGNDETLEGPDLSDALIFTDLCNPNAQCGDVEPDEGAAFAVNNAMTVPLRCCYPFFYCEVENETEIWFASWNVFRSTSPLQTLPLDSLVPIEEVFIPEGTFSGELMNDTWNGGFGGRPGYIVEQYPQRCGEYNAVVALVGIAGPPVYLEVNWGGLLPGFKGQLVRVFRNTGPCAGDLGWTAAFDEDNPDEQDVVEGFVQDEIIKPVERTIPVEFFRTQGVSIETVAFPSAFEEIEIQIPGQPQIQSDVIVIDNVITTEATCPVPIPASHAYWQFGRTAPKTQSFDFLPTDFATGTVPLITSVGVDARTIVEQIDTYAATVLVSAASDPTATTIPIDWGEVEFTLQKFYDYTLQSITSETANLVDAITTAAITFRDTLGTHTNFVGQVLTDTITGLDYGAGTVSTLTLAEPNASPDIWFITEVGTQASTIITDLTTAPVTFITSTNDRAFIAGIQTTAVPVVAPVTGYVYTDIPPTQFVTDLFNNQVNYVADIPLDFISGVVVAGFNNVDRIITSVNLSTSGTPFINIIDGTELTAFIDSNISSISYAYDAGTQAITFLTSTNDRSFIVDFDTTSVTVTNELGTTVGITVVTDVNLTVLDNTTTSVFLTDLNKTEAVFVENVTVLPQPVATAWTGAFWPVAYGINVGSVLVGTQNLTGIGFGGPTTSFLTYVEGSELGTAGYNLLTVADIETSVPMTVVTDIVTTALDNVQVATIPATFGFTVSTNPEAILGVEQANVDTVTAFLDPSPLDINRVTQVDVAGTNSVVTVATDFEQNEYDVIQDINETGFYAFSTIVGDYGVAFATFPGGDGAPIQVVGGISGFQAGSFMYYDEATAQLVTDISTNAVEFVSTIATSVATLPVSFAGTGPITLITDPSFTSFFPIDGTTTCTVLLTNIETTSIDVVTSFLSGTTTSILLPSGSSVTDREVLVPFTETGTADFEFLVSASPGCSDDIIKVLGRGTELVVGTEVNKNWDESDCTSCAGWNATTETVEDTDCRDFFLLRAKYVKQGDGWYPAEGDGSIRKYPAEPSCSCFDGADEGEVENPDWYNRESDPGAASEDDVGQPVGKSPDYSFPNPEGFFHPCVVPFQRIAVRGCVFCREIPQDSTAQWPYLPNTPYSPDEDVVDTTPML